MNLPVQVGTIIGQQPHPFPGLTDTAGRLHELASKVAELEARNYELGAIRSTLLLNFGSTPHNRYGMLLMDEGSTQDLLMAVLSYLTYRPNINSGLNHPNGLESTEK